MSKLKHLGWLTSMLLCTEVASAGWNSGGGELYSDDQNPWFLVNTPRVSYCIEVDQNNFGAPIDQIRANVANVFNYWKQQFSIHPRTAINFQLDIQIGTQTFIEESCAEGTMIKFQMGTLTSQQADFLKHPKQTIASSVRTEYDPVELRGKGFVYVSPEAGPYALSGIGSSSGGYQILPNRWTHAGGKILEFVLAHEIGHIFGFQHTAENLLMASDRPSQWVSSYSQQTVNENTLFPLLEIGFERGLRCEYCFTGDFGSKFGLPRQDPNFSIKYDSGRRVFSFFQKDTAGDLKLFGYTNSAKLYSYQRANLEVYVTKEQTVFPAVIPDDGVMAESSSIETLSASATYFSTNGLVREIKINWAGGFITLDTIDQGKYLDGAGYLSLESL